MDERYLHAHFDTPHFSYCELDFLDHQGFTMDAPSYISFWKRSSAIYPTWTALPAWIFFFLLSSFAWGNFTIFNRPFQRILIPFLDSILDLRFFLLSLRVLLISFWTLHSASEIARGFGVYTTYKDCLIIIYFFVFHFWFSILKKEVRKTRYGVLVWEGVLGSACCLLAKIPKKWRCCIHGVIILWVEAIVGHVFKLSIHFIPAVGYYWRPRTLTACLFILLPALSNPSDVCRQKVVSPFDCPSRGSCDSS